MNPHPKKRDYYFRNAHSEAEKAKVLKENKKNGKIVSSIDELICAEHHKSKFKINERLELIRLEKPFVINTYICKICEKETSETPTKAYDCPISCKGIVYGEPKITTRIRPRDLVRLNIGKDLREYTCSVCNQYLGGIPLEKQQKIN
ncbi:MAG: hypothetical protein PHU51_02090 [Candidatus Nanoarchaeia archaeon]|nr:hypothetical protein [Candidatus Nanoarchaeia archaeon]